MIIKTKHCKIIKKWFNQLRNLGIIMALLTILSVNAFAGGLSLTVGKGFAEGDSSDNPYGISYKEKITSTIGYKISYFNYWHFMKTENRNNHPDGIALQLTAGRDYGSLSLNAGIGPIGLCNTINEKVILYETDIISGVSADIKLHGGFFWRTEANYTFGFNDGIRAFFVLTGPGFDFGQVSSKSSFQETGGLKDWVAVSGVKSVLNNLGSPISNLGMVVETGRELSENVALSLLWMNEGEVDVKDGSKINRSGFILEPLFFVNLLNGEAGIGAGPYYRADREKFIGIVTAFVAYPLGHNLDFRAAWDRILDGNQGADVFRGGLGFRF
jgi:hypothetical protein